MDLLVCPFLFFDSCTVGVLLCRVMPLDCVVGSGAWVAEQDVANATEEKPAEATKSDSNREMFSELMHAACLVRLPCFL